LAAEASSVIVAKGKNVLHFDIKEDAPDDETLLSHLLGPTGNVRAPTLRVGKTLLVGFNEDAYGDVL
jgi:ABC-type arginine transport system ATPase subunit